MPSMENAFASAIVGTGSMITNAKECDRVIKSFRDKLAPMFAKFKDGVQEIRAFSRDNRIPYLITVSLENDKELFDRFVAELGTVKGITWPGLELQNEREDGGLSAVWNGVVEVAIGYKGRERTVIG